MIFTSSAFGTHGDAHGPKPVMVASSGSTAGVPPSSHPFTYAQVAGSSHPGYGWIPIQCHGPEFLEHEKAAALSGQQWCQPTSAPTMPYYEFNPSIEPSFLHVPYSYKAHVKASRLSNNNKKKARCSKYRNRKKNNNVMYDNTLLTKIDADTLERKLLHDL